MFLGTSGSSIQLHFVQNELPKYECKRSSARYGIGSIGDKSSGSAVGG